MVSLCEAAKGIFQLTIKLFVSHNNVSKPFMINKFYYFLNASIVYDIGFDCGIELRMYICHHGDRKRWLNLICWKEIFLKQKTWILWSICILEYRVKYAEYRLLYTLHDQMI